MSTLLITRASKIAAGANHSIILIVDKSVYGCGSNQQGQLGSPGDSIFNLSSMKRKATISESIISPKHINFSCVSNSELNEHNVTDEDEFSEVAKDNNSITLNNLVDNRSNHQTEEGQRSSNMAILSEYITRLETQLQSTRKNDLLGLSSQIMNAFHTKIETALGEVDQIETLNSSNLLMQRIGLLNKVEIVI